MSAIAPETVESTTEVAKKVAKKKLKVKGKKAAVKRAKKAIAKAKKQKSQPRSERTSVPCCINFPRKLLNKLDRKAKAGKLSRAGAVNMLIERWVK